MADSAAYYTFVFKTYVGETDAINIKDNGFAYMGMDEIYFPEAETVGKNAFIGCASIREIVMEKVKMVGDYAFMSCSDANPIRLPEVVQIGNAAFSGCSSAAEICVPKAETIGNTAFQDCSAMSEIDIPLATSLGEYAFRDCYQMKDVDGHTMTTGLQKINALNLVRIGKGAFYGCKLLEEATFPKAVEIGDETFGDCESLEMVEIPSATTIGNDIFKDCPNLKSINMQSLPASQLKEGMFKSLSNLQWLNVQSELTVAAITNTYRTHLGLRGSVNVVCSDGINTGTQAPSQLTELSYGTSTDNPTILGVKSGVTEIPGNLMENYAKTIGAEAFKGRMELKTAIFSAVSLEVGLRAFMDCKNLVNISLPQIQIGTSNSRGIKQNAFSGCTALKCLSLGGSTKAEVQQAKANWGLPSGCIVICKDGIV